MNQETKEQSALLTQFYQAYAGWLDAGAPDRMGFTRSTGLCANLNWWLHQQQALAGDAVQAIREMQFQFREAGLGEQFPFNRMDGDFYVREADFESCHLNEQRIKWVRDHAAI